MAGKYKPSVGVQGGLYPLGEFPTDHANNIEMGDGRRLNEFEDDVKTRMSVLENQKIVFLTEEEYNALLDAGEVDEETKYMIIEGG